MQTYNSGAGKSCQRNEVNLFFECDERPSTRPATSAQYYIRHVIKKLYPIDTINISLTVKIERLLSRERVLRVIREIVQQHIALRTSFPTDDANNILQDVAAKGWISVTFLNGPEKAMLNGELSLGDDLERTHFAIENELPVRFGVILVDGAPKSLIMVCSHMVADGYSKRLLYEELDRALNGDGDVGVRGQSWTPIDLADWEMSPNGSREMERSLSFWRRELTLFPRAMFYHKSNAGAPQWNSLHLNSPSIGHACHSLARLHKVSTETILLVGFAAVLSHLLKTSRFSTAVVFANRLRAELRASIGNFAQSTPIALNLDSGGFAAVVRLVQSKLLEAYMHARGLPRAIEGIAAEIAETRGMAVEIDSHFNISHEELRRDQDERSMRPPSLCNELRSKTKIEHGESRSFDIHTFSLHSRSSSTMFILYDTSYISDALAEQIALSVQEILISAALQKNAELPQLLTSAKLSPLELTCPWAEINGSWVDREAIRSLLMSSGELIECAVFGDHRSGFLTAYLVAKAAEFDFEYFAKTKKPDLLNGRSTILPRMITLCRRFPSEVGNINAWEQMEKIQVRRYY